MSQGLYLLDLTKKAGADLSTTGQYLIVKADSTAEQVVLAAAASDRMLGVLQNKPKSGEAALIRVAGTSKVVAGGTVAYGDYVTTNGSGQAVTTTTDKQAIIGLALESAVVNDIFEIMIVHGYLSV